jgi:hypothetical protein
MKKVTNPRHAWGMTLAAALDLFAFVLLASSNPSPLLLALFGLCEVVLILCAVGAWKQYFEFRMDQLTPQRPDSSSETQP